MALVGGCQARSGDRNAQSLATTQVAARVQGGGDAQEHSHGWTYRVRILSMVMDLSWQAHLSSCLPAGSLAGLHVVPDICYIPAF